MPRRHRRRKPKPFVPSQASPGITHGGYPRIVVWLLELIFGKQPTNPQLEAEIEDPPSLKQNAPRTRSSRRRRQPRALKPAWMKGYNDVIAQVAAGKGPPLLPGAAKPSNPPVTPTKMPFTRCDRVLSKGEFAFMHPLYYAVKGKYRIFPKVRLGDVVQGPQDSASDRYWFRKIAGFHLDFVLCDPDTTAPLMVIELDDRSHRTPKSQQRDRFKDQILASAGIPTLRIPAQQAYEPAALASAVEGLLTPPANPSPSPQKR